jgi:hypothetical protein
MLNTETNFAARRFVHGLPPMPEPFRAARATTSFDAQPAADGSIAVISAQVFEHKGRPRTRRRMYRNNGALKAAAQFTRIRHAR